MTGIFEQVWQFIAGKATELVGPFLDWLYLVSWYWWGGLIVLACIAVAVFLPFKWTKIVAGWIASLAIIAVWAATVATKHFTKKKADESKPAPPRPIDDQGARWNPFGKW